MLKGFTAWTIAVIVALIICSPLSSGQTAQATASRGAAPAPAPRHDISGTWTPARGEGDGIGGQGARDSRKTASRNISYLTPLWRGKR